MITTGNNIPELINNDDDVYYNKTNVKTNTRSLRDFHNLYIKSKLINGVAERDDILIDYAVGKGGDLPKWIHSNLRFVFGIDISKDNINNSTNGACVRYLNNRSTYTNIPDALFISGNSGLNIREGTAFTENDIRTGKPFASEREAQISKAVFGSGPKDAQLLGKGVYNQYGVAEGGFNISSCQFALHYFFENEYTVHQFIRNLSECTKIGGHFIGTCYDGRTVFNLLHNKRSGESMTIMKDEYKMFEITKMYDNPEFQDDSTGIGYTVNVYQESINKTFSEYLVNFNYFVQLMENYGFVLITKEESTRMKLPNSNGMFSELFTMMENEVESKIKQRVDYKSSLLMTPEEQRISFLNRYFVFKKIRSVDAAKISNIIIKQSVLVLDNMLQSPTYKMVDEDEPVIDNDPTIEVDVIEPVVNEPVIEVIDLEPTDQIMVDEPIIEAVPVVVSKPTFAPKPRKLRIINKK
jgi:mRNA (guanine-N7-)-methyltransferase